jgi:hypothetical protein
VTRGAAEAGETAASAATIASAMKAIVRERGEEDMADEVADAMSSPHQGTS